MLKPVQRLPQYRLLLENYIKALTPDDEDYGDAVEALGVVSEAAEHANEKMKQNVSYRVSLEAHNPYALWDRTTGGPRVFGWSGLEQS